MSRKIKRVFYERNQGKILGRNQGAKGSFKKKHETYGIFFLDFFYCLKMIFEQF